MHDFSCGNYIVSLYIHGAKNRKGSVQPVKMGYSEGMDTMGPRQLPGLTEREA